MSILNSLPGIVAGAAGFMFKSAAINVPGAPTPDGQGGEIPGTPTAHACAALVTDYSDTLRGLSNGAIALHDRKATVLGASLGALVPQIGWTIDVDGARWSIIRVARDPAAATYDLQIRPA